MADMPTGFWAGWIAVVTLASLFALGWLIFSAYFSPETKDEQAGGPVWDENLTEGEQPAPIWWFWLIFLSMIFSVIYLMLYPGLGSYAGALNWSQGGRVEQNLELYDSEFGGTRRLVAEAKLETLHADERFMASAQRVYDRNCAVCHGYDAQGQARHFPDLSDDEWQWGGTPDRIEQSIRQGRRAVMVGWLPMLGEEGVDNVTDYVMNLGTEAADGHTGQAQYNQFCVACHGPGGAGNTTLGAPSLVDDVWLYGGDEAAIRQSIAAGRNGQMPAFGARLDDTQVRLLVALLTRP